MFGAPVTRALAGVVDDRVAGLSRAPQTRHLDLADSAVPVSSGGWLIHFLSDSQWVLHWLLYTGTDGAEAVVVTRRELGFELGEDGDEEVPRVFEAGSGQAEVCTESLSEFVYRFWIENEIWFRVNKPTDRELPLLLRRLTSA